MSLSFLFIFVFKLKFGGRLRARLNGEFQPRLKFCRDYMADFSTGAKFEIGRENLPGSVIGLIMAPMLKLFKIGALLFS